MFSNQKLTKHQIKADTMMVAEESLHTLRIAVCDDEKEQLERLKQAFEDATVPVSLQVEYFETAKGLMEELQMRSENGAIVPEVIFCDIKMPEMDGITFGKKLRDISKKLYLVLFTAYPEYAIQGYETQAFRYLLKPVMTSDIEQVLCAILREIGSLKKLIMRTAEQECVVPLSDMIYLSAEDKYTILHEKEEYYVDRKSLSDYEKVLEPYGFFRIHRKYIVNLAQHKSMGGGEVVLLDGTKLPISRRREADYHTRLLKMLGEELL